MNRTGRVIVFVLSLIVLVFLPIIPISSTAVIPEPVYTIRLIAPVQAILFLVVPLVGVSYRWSWYSFLVLAAVVLVGVLVGIWALRKRDEPAG
jgi:hypothetical protein